MYLVEGLRLAFEFFGDVPRRVIFDNARVAVKSGSGKKAVAQDAYDAMAIHYCFKTEFCNVRKGNEKGLVEGLVGLTRRNIFVPVPNVSSLAELNETVLKHCESYIDTHRIKGKPASVKEMLLADRAALLPLPLRPYDASIVAEARVSSYSAVRFLTNDYSVPTEYVGQTVAVRGYAEVVKIYAAGKEIASHERCYDKGQKILDPKHYQKLLAQKPRSILQARPVRAAFSSELKPEYIKALSSCDFIDRHENLTMIGSPGTGKTHLLTALGVKACLKGYKVLFRTATDLVTELREAKDSYQLNKLTKGIAGVDLLLIDELSYASFNREESELLFKVIAERSEKSSTAITTNLEFSKWTEIFSSETLVAALVDRLTYRSTVLNMNGASYRYTSRKSESTKA